MLVKMKEYRDTIRPGAKRTTIIKNWTITKVRKHNNPNNKIFARILKVIFVVIAILGKKVKKPIARLQIK